MAERKKLELELNKPQVLELLFDEPMIGNSKYGEYYLYAVKNGGDTEYSFFAPVEIHEKLKNCAKGNKIEITKTAEQQGKKILTKFDAKILPEVPNKNEPGSNTNGNGTKDTFFEIMLQSYQDAMKINETLNGLGDIHRISITLFIARSKLNGNGGYN